MANNIEVVLTGQDAGFTDTLTKAAATLTAKNAEMLASLGKVAQGLGATSASANDAGAQIAASASKYSQLSAAAQQLAAVQVTAKAQMKELSAAIKAGSVDAISGKAAMLELQAAVRAAGAQYSEAARNISSSAGAIVGSHQRMSIASMEVMHSVRSASDSFAAGLPITTIFAEQISRLGEAAALTGSGGGALGKLGAFMAGPWGIVVLGATAVLGVAISKMHLFGDEVADATKKLTDQAHANDIAAQAQQRFGMTIDGSLEKMRKLNEELERRLKNQGEINSQQTQTVGIDLTTAKGNVGTAQTAFDKARQDRDSTLAALKHPGVGATPEEIQGLASAFRTAEANFVKAQTDLAHANAAVIIGERDLRAARALELQEQAKGILDPQLGQKQALEAQQTKLKNDYLAGNKTDAEYQAGYQRIQGQIDALTQKTSAAAENSLGQMIALIKKLFPGAIITSTTGGKHVAGSDHYTGHAIDFVPAGGMNSISAAAVEKMLKDAGVNIRRNAEGVEQFFDNDNGKHNHFHVAWTGTPNVDEANRKAEAAQRKAAEDAQKEVERLKSFHDADDDLDKKLLDAKKKQTRDIDALAQIQLGEIQVASDKYVTDLRAKETAGEMTEAQRKELIANDNILIAKHAILVTIQEQEVIEQAKAKKLDEDLAIWTIANDNQKELLTLQEQFAVTAQDRRAIQLQILASEKEAARKAAQEVLAKPIGQTTDEQRQKAQGTLDNLDAKYALQQRGVLQSTESPLDAYIRQNDPKLIGEKVQKLEVEELDSVRKGIDDAISNVLGVKDPFLRGLIDMFIQEVLIDPIAKALQAHTGSGGGGFFGQLLGAVAGAVGGGGFGGGLNSTAGGIVSQLSPMSVAGLATGGAVTGLGSDTSDSIDAKLSNGEYVLRAAAVRAIGVSNLDMINKGPAPRFAEGGLVGWNHNIPMGSTVRTGGDVHVHIHPYPGMPMSQARETGRQAASAAAQEQAKARRLGIAA